MTDDHSYDYVTWVFEAPPVTWVEYETVIETAPYEWPPDGAWMTRLYGLGINPGASTPVLTEWVAVPGVQFRVVCDRPYTARFYGADGDFTTIVDAAELPGTADSHAATTETGIVYAVDPGAYNYIACVVTNDDAQLALITISTRQEGEIQTEIQTEIQPEVVVEVVHTEPSTEPPWPGAYRDVLRLYGWHVVAVSLASGWMTGGLGCRWRTDDLESSRQAAARRASWKAHEMTDSWQIGALSDGGTP